MKKQIIHYCVYIVLFASFGIMFTKVAEARVDAGLLSVDRILSQKLYAVDDATYENGFRWVARITVPLNEPTVQFKFADLESGPLRISIKDSLRYYSPQSSNVNDEKSAIIIPVTGQYFGRMDINHTLDLDNEKSGTQIDVYIEVSVPKNSKPSKYEMKYGLKSFDDIKPVLSLNGSSTVFLERESSYVDLGVSVSDNQYFPVTYIDDYSDLKTNVSGTYIVKYNATDLAGNQAIELSRTVKVIDTTNPIITLSNYSNSIPTKNDIVVTASTSEGFLNATSHTFTQNSNFDFVATDLAGNVSTSTVSITNIDKTPPTLALSGASHITLERKTAYTEYGAAAIDAYDGPITPIIDASRVKVDLVGDYTVTYKAVDRAGNSYTKYRYIKIVDTTPPKITISEYTTVPVNKDIVVNATTNEGTLNASQHTFTSNDIFIFEAIDISGNKSEKTVDIRNIDKNPPLISLLGDSRIAIERGNDFKDPGVLADDLENPGITVSNDSTTSLDLTKIGNYTITYTAKDIADNSSSITRNVIVEDNLAPNITITYSETSLTKNNVTLTASIDEPGTLDYSSHEFEYNDEPFTFTATDDYGNISELTVHVENIDRIAPEIISDPVVRVIEGTSIPAVIYTVSDNLDPNPIVSDDRCLVDTSIVGEYFVTVSASDSAGNISVPITINVSVIPSITLPE